MNLHIALVTALVSACAPAIASERAAAGPGISAEGRFLARHGEEATKLAPGVYELRDGHGRLERRSFGRDGLLWERARAAAQLDALLADEKTAAHDSRIELLETRLAAYAEALGSRAAKSMAESTRNLCGTQGYTYADGSSDFAYGGGSASVQATGPARVGLAIVSVSYDNGSQSESTLEWRKDSLTNDGVANVSVSNGGGPQFCNHVVSSASLSVSGCADGYMESTVEWPEGGCGW